VHQLGNPMSRNSKGRAIVAGAGIIGACAGLALQRDGWDVTLLDPAEPGSKCSFGNAGLIATSILPLASPATLRKLPGLLAARNGPVALRWRSAVPLAPWFARFVRASSAARFRSGAAALHRLGTEAFAAYEGLLGPGLARYFRPGGYLIVYEDEDTFRASLETVPLRQSLGADLVVLDAASARAMEPRLGDIRGAIHIRNAHHVVDPQGLVRFVADQIVAGGGRIVREGLLRCGRGTPGDALSVEHTGGTAAAERVILAAGVDSRALGRTFGVSLPIVAERGYHAMLKQPSEPLRYPIMSGEGAFVLTPMVGGLRLAGLTEFASARAPARYQPLEAALARAQRLLTALEPRPLSRWMGARPSTRTLSPSSAASHAMRRSSSQPATAMQASPSAP
jgi:D-amino-acid dehydrogenase